MTFSWLKIKWRLKKALIYVDFVDKIMNICNHEGAKISFFGMTIPIIIIIQKVIFFETVVLFLGTCTRIHTYAHAENITKNNIFHPRSINVERTEVTRMPPRFLFHSTFGPLCAYHKLKLINSPSIRRTRTFLHNILSIYTAGDI